MPILAVTATCTDFIRDDVSGMGALPIVGRLRDRQLLVMTSHCRRLPAVDVLGEAFVMVESHFDNIE